MLNNKTIAVVIPAYNEEKQIEKVILELPRFVDYIIVVNDGSKDKTENVVKNLLGKTELNKKKFTHKRKKKEYILYTSEKNQRLVLITLLSNSGPGMAVCIGYNWCREKNIDCIAKMDGDGQMDSSELEALCRPIIYDNIDCAKGNRLIHQSAWTVIPKARYFGNSILSILTKFASGYWHVSDTQTGYIAISRKSLNSLNLERIYTDYGYPNDILVKLNIAFCTIKEIEIKPIYNIGESSKMKIYKVIPKISFLLLKSFFKRLWVKYFFRDFHPLFLFYHFSFIIGTVTLPIFIKIFKLTIYGERYPIPLLLLFTILVTSGIQFFLFAMWMDIQDNERLHK